MAEISKITLPSGNTYDLKDAVARQMISGGVSFIIAWDGASTPVVGNIPAGVKVTYNGTTYTGTMSAESAQAGAFYLVKSSTETETEILDIYDEYVPVGETGTKTWEKIGDTKIDLSDVVTGVTLNKQTDVALGESTTFALASGNVTHGSLTGHTDTVLGTGSTFNVTQPTISVTPSTTYLGASASGVAVGADGTANAITGFGTHTTDTFVKSVSVTQGNKLVTTTVPNVTGNSSVSIPNVTGNTSVTANKSTWTFTMGTGDNAETLIIGGGNGSDVTATNTTLGANLTATNTTLGTAITVATGSATSSGTGAALVTGVEVGDSATAITALGTPTTSTVLTGVKVTSQPSVSLSANASTGTGRVQVATGISSASASGAAVSASGDNVTAIVSMPTSTVGTGITVGTNDKITTLTNGTSITVTKGN